MRKANLVIKVILCVICLALILGVIISLFTMNLTFGSVRTERDLNRVLTFIIVASILLVGILGFGIFLILKSKKQMDMLFKEEELDEQQEH